MIVSVYTSKLQRYEQRMRQNVYWISSVLQDFKLQIHAFQPASQMQIKGKCEDIQEDLQHMKNRLLTLLMLQAPVADDLKRISHDLEILRELERICSHLLSIQEIAEENPELEEEHLYHLLIMSVQMAETLGNHLDSEDVQMLSQVQSMDENIDRAYETFLEDVARKLQGIAPDALNQINYLMYAKYLERICDGFVRIAGIRLQDYPVFMQTEESMQNEGKFTD